MKGIKVLSVILFILLLVCIGVIVFGFIKYNDLKKDNDSLKKKVEELSKKDYIKTGDIKTTNDDSLDLKYIEVEDKNNKGIKIHSVYSYGAVFSVNEDLYLVVDHKGLSGLSVGDVISSAKDELPTVGNPKTYENDKFNKKYTVYNLDLKTSDVVATKIQHLSTHRDITSEVFIIYKDGGLSNYVINSKQIEIGKKYLTDYKIKDIEEKCSNEICEIMTYVLTLQDGTTKELSNLE